MGSDGFRYLNKLGYVAQSIGTYVGSPARILEPPGFCYHDPPSAEHSKIDVQKQVRSEMTLPSPFAL
jgi:hypothetical protein